MNVLRAAAEAHNEGVKCAQAGDYGSAILHLRNAVRLAGFDAVDPRTLKALWDVAIKGGDWSTGIAAALRAAARDPGDYEFVHKAVLSLARCPRTELMPENCFPTMSFPSTLPSLSVVLVSANDERFALANDEYERAFAGWPHERIRVNDARSMYDGYARGYAQTSGEVIVFSHDDIRFAIPDFAPRLADAIADSDMIGVAGTTRVSGPALLWAGHPYLFGTITQKADSESDYEFGVLSLAGPRIRGAQGLDGVFIAARRTLVERIGFDAERFTGFHFYDLDFSYRAHLAGARVTIASDLALIHKSRGSFDDRWTEAQRVFARKFTLGDMPPGREHHWYAVRLPDSNAVARMYYKLFAAWTLRLV